MLHVNPSRRKFIGSSALGIAGSALTRKARAVGRVTTDGAPPLIGHWKLAGDFLDATGRHHGTGRDVIFGPGRNGAAGQVARFDGVRSFVEVPHHAELALGTRDFSISAWVKAPDDVEGVGGDVLSKFDPAERRGLSLGIGASSGGYSSVGDARHLRFGIDAGINGSWSDCGKPWSSNPLIGTLTVFKGDLYTGIADASKPEEACHVFRYGGASVWVDCGRVGGDLATPTVMSMIVHRGHLYAGTGTWNWDLIPPKVKVPKSGPDHVYRYEGDRRWHDCGQFGEGRRVMCLASFKGDLYAGDDAGRCYRFDGDGRWTFCGGQLDGERLYTMVAYRGQLWAAGKGSIFRYEGGTTWTNVGKNPLGSTQIHKIQVFGGRLYAGTWPYGKILRYESDNDWTDCGQVGISTEKHKINEINDLTVYNGKLYAGVIPKAEIYRYDGEQDWTRLRSLVSSPRWSPANIRSWFRVPSMTTFAGKLFMGTSTCHGAAGPDAIQETGRVYAMEAGRNVSYDDDLGTAWRHVVAVRERNVLRLYVDGKLRATSSSFAADDYQIGNEAPLLIGFGANYFRGEVGDVRLHGGALTVREVARLRALSQSGPFAAG